MTNISIRDPNTDTALTLNEVYQIALGINELDEIKEAQTNLGKSPIGKTTVTLTVETIEMIGHRGQKNIDHPRKVEGITLSSQNLHIMLPLMLRKKISYVPLPNNLSSGDPLSWENSSTK